MDFPARPKSISVIGWSWVTIAAIHLVIWAPTLLAGPKIKLILWISIYLAYFTATYRFLRLRPKARGTLEALTWLALLAVIAIAFIQLTAVLVAPSQLPATGNRDVSLLLIVGFVLVVIDVVIAVPLIFIIKTLRSKVVVDVFQQNRLRLEAGG